MSRVTHDRDCSLLSHGRNGCDCGAERIAACTDHSPDGLVSATPLKVDAARVHKAVMPSGVNYGVVFDFANKHGLQYNEIAAMIREALLTRPVNPADLLGEPNYPELIVQALKHTDIRFTVTDLRDDTSLETGEGDAR